MDFFAIHKRYNYNPYVNKLQRTVVLAIPQKRKDIERLNGRYCPHRGLRKWLRWENLSFLEPVLEGFLKGCGLYQRGYKNVLNLQLSKTTFYFSKLPIEFDGFRILWISDLHSDRIEGLLQRIFDIIEPLSWDLAVIGGDFCFGHSMTAKAGEHARQLATYLVKKSTVLAVLGNHDFSEIAEILATSGVEVLLNRSKDIRRGNQRIWFVGIDDCHYFRSDELDLATKDIDNSEFKILLSHSPEIYRQAARMGFDLLISGHTHGGQICLWGGIPLVSSIDAPRKCIRGVWQEGTMVGFTSQGAGASGVAVRFNCRGQINLLTLRSGVGAGQT